MRKKFQSAILRLLFTRLRYAKRVIVRSTPLFGGV